VTGVSAVGNELGPKRLALLHDLLPNATTIAALLNPINPNAQSDADELLVAARSLGLNLIVFQASNERDIDRFFATLITQRVSAFMLTADPLFSNRRDQLVMAVASHAIPAMFAGRTFTVAGGLMSYGTNPADVYRKVGVYTGQVLKGTKVAPRGTKGHQARRPPGYAADQVRVRHQPQDRQCARPYHSAEPACHRR
jgi:putative tryptophan/tyrosine transport system substrate-binding protein